MTITEKEIQERELQKVRLDSRSNFGKKAYLKNPIVGKWYCFTITSIGSNSFGYGKIVEIDEDGKHALVEKYFELPSYRPYAAHHWFDRLPVAVFD